MQQEDAGWNIMSYFFATVGIFLASILSYVYWKLSYWKRHGIIHIKPTFPFGNTKDALLGRRPYAIVIHELCQKLRGNPFAGIYMALQPTLIVMEPEIIKDVVIRCAYSNFQDHIANPDINRDPIMAKNLFMAKGNYWRSLRSSLSHAFTSGKIKTMYPLIMEKGHLLAKKMDEIASSTDPKVDVRLNFARFTTDAIASCGFGIETDSINNPDNEFLKMGLKTMERTFRHSLDMAIVFQFPSLVKITGAVIIVKEVADFFRHLVWSVIKERETKDIKRGDYIDLLIQLKNKGKIQADGERINADSEQEKAKSRSIKKFDGDDLVANAFMFYFAGYETSTTTMNFTLIELAANPECQEQLLKEIDSTLEANGGEISFEVLHNMRYLDMVVNETLRKYPPLVALDRLCTSEYRNEEYNLVIPKGMQVLIPVYTIQRDPALYPDPEKFIPERFTEEAKKSRPNYSFMTFGEGPRVCLGMRFGMTQVKIGLISVLKNFKFSLPEELKGMTSPLLESNSFLIAPEDSIRLVITRRKPIISK